MKITSFWRESEEIESWVDVSSAKLTAAAAEVEKTPRFLLGSITETLEGREKDCPFVKETILGEQNCFLEENPGTQFSVATDNIIFNC